MLELLTYEITYIGNAHQSNTRRTQSLLWFELVDTKLVKNKNKNILENKKVKNKIKFLYSILFLKFISCELFSF